MMLHHFLPILSSSGSRPCPGQLQMDKRSIDSQSLSQVSGLDLEIDSIIVKLGVQTMSRSTPENFKVY